MAVWRVQHEGEEYDVQADTAEEAATTFDPPAFDEAGASDAYKGGLQELSAQTQNPALEKYRDMGPLARAGTSAYDSVNLLAQGLTHGYGDKVGGWARSKFTGNSAEEETAKLRANTEASRQRQGGVGAALELAGNVYGPMKAAGALKAIAPGAAASLSTMGGWGGTAARTGAAALEGLGWGAIDAHGNDQDVGTGATVGALAGPAGKLLGHAATGATSKVAGLFNKAPDKITKEMLEKEGSDAFEEATRQGVMFTPQAVRDVSVKIRDDLAKLGFDEVNEPGVLPIIHRLRDLTGQNLTYEGLHSLRRVAQNGWRPGAKSNNLALSKVIGHIDDLEGTQNPAHILTGNGPAAAEAGKRGRAAWHKARKVDTLEQLKERGSRLGSRLKHQDVPGTTRREFHKIIDNPRLGRGFSKAEKELAKKATTHTNTQRALHLASTAFPQGQLGIGGHAALALSTGFNPLVLAGQAGAAALGWGAKQANDAISEKAFSKFVDHVARGGPAPVVENALQRLSKSQRDNVIRALTMGGISLAPQGQ